MARIIIPFNGSKSVARRKADQALANSIPLAPVPRMYTLKELGSNLLRLKLGDKCSDIPGIDVIDQGYIRADPHKATIVQLSNEARVSIVQLSGAALVLLKRKIF